MRNSGFVLAAGLLLIAGCSGIGGGSSTKNVSAKDNQFDPVSMNIKQNDVAKFTNVGNNPHTVTIHKGGDGAGVTKKDTEIPKGSATEFKFEETGTFHVYCKYHCTACTTGQFSSGGMMTTITVTA